MSQKTSIPSGTRDFLPSEMVCRNYIFNTIRNVFQKYGYLPIETPAMENLTTLMGKYGEEGDKLLFRILNSGNFVNGIDPKELTPSNELETVKLSSRICEKGLRYDLTVPFARFVVQHRNDLAFPFKRYQIQPVWRADRPQKGRYREFYQCDVDAIGSDSLLNEVELIQIVEDVFTKLDLAVTIKINNRKILTGIAELIGKPEKITDITIVIDKLEKIGLEKVVEELKTKELSDEDIEKILPIIELTGTNEEKAADLKKILKTSEIGLKGIEEIERILKFCKEIDIKTEIELDLSLARGLNYYTGVIFEIKSNKVHIGSICGGGRYDDLTGIFGLKNMSGVGISFGADRIYDALNQLNLYPEQLLSSSHILFINFGDKEAIACMSWLKKVRNSGYNAELYPDNAKIKKQMEYADKKGIPFTALLGETEILDDKINIKDMSNGEQYNLTIEEVIDLLNRNFAIE